MTIIYKTFIDVGLLDKMLVPRRGHIEINPEKTSPTELPVGSLEFHCFHLSKPVSNLSTTNKQVPLEVILEEMTDFREVYNF